MYETFFGLTERPFTLRPDPAFLYLSHQHALALSMLEFGLTGQAGFVVVSGEIGSGKTTLIRHFLKCDEGRATIGVISNTHPGFGDILQWACQALNIEAGSPTKAARYHALTKYLAEQYAIGQQVVLVVDEAQNLSIPALESLRLLSNIDVDLSHSLQIILVGQPELLQKLRRPELRQFAQRISVHYHLSPLTYSESCAYVRHRLAVAGATNDVFDSWAMAGVYYFADGVPRVMNSICDMAMVYAYAAGQPLIGIDTIYSVVRDREKNGIQALARRSSDISRDALIERAIRSFDQTPPAQVAYGSPEEMPPMLPRINGTVYEEAKPVDGGSPTGQNGIVVAWSGDDRISDPISDPALSPIVAEYLPDDVFYQDGVLGPRKLNALQWLRRHLNSSGDR